MPSRIQLYKARWNKFRTTRGSPEWHEAMAVIRAYAGEDFEANLHNFTAFVQRAAKRLLDCIKEIFNSLTEIMGEETQTLQNT